MQEQYNMNGKDFSALPIIVEQVIFTSSAAKCYKQKQLSTAQELSWLSNVFELTDRNFLVGLFMGISKNCIGDC